MDWGDIMLLDLSRVLSEQHLSLDETVPCSIEAFQKGNQTFPVRERDDVKVSVEHVEGRTYRIRAAGRLVLEIPCDRCLEPVRMEFKPEYDRKVVLGGEDAGQAEQSEETSYIDGYALDADELVRKEILIGWPAKILCREDCKGICSVCGQNLNEGTCNCEDTGLDPRMSVIRDVFKNFKEV